MQPLSIILEKAEWFGWSQDVAVVAFTRIFERVVETNDELGRRFAKHLPRDTALNLEANINRVGGDATILDT